MKKLTSLLLALCLLLSCCAALAETPVTPFAEVDTENFTINWADPLNALIFGMYSHEVEMANGATRTVYQYIPTTWHYGQPEVGVAVPSGEDPIAFFENTGWKEASEKGPFAVVLMTAEDWTEQDEYIAACYKFMNNRANVHTLKVAFYMVGYGDAANQVMEFAVTNNDTLAGVAAFGVDSFDNSLLELGRTTDTSVAGVKKADVAVPMWLGVEARQEGTDELIAYWKKAAGVSDQKFSNEYAEEVYFYPSYLSNTFELTYQNIASVYVTVGLDKVLTPEFTDNLYFNFLGRVRRTYSNPLRPLKYYATTEELGFEHYTFDMNGVGREYWVYVPQQVKATDEKAPLVFVAHGGSDSGEEFITITDWYKAAEERGFILVHLMGSRANDKFKASTTWTPADVEYVKTIREAMIASYPVDTARIYMTGHSMGSCLTQYCTVLCPELFAAACGNDALNTEEELKALEGIPTEFSYDVVIPYMLNAGTKDQNFIEGKGKDFDQIPEFFAGWCQRYGMDYDLQYQFQNGIHHGIEWHNAQGIPMAKLTWDEGKVHCMDANDPYVIYDFLSCFSRAENGACLYMGVEVK